MRITPSLAAESDTINGYTLVLTQEDYNRFSGGKYQLAEDEVLLFMQDGKTVGDSINLFDRPYRVQAYVEQAIPQLESVSITDYITFMIVVPDNTTIAWYTEGLSKPGKLPSRDQQRFCRALLRCGRGNQAGIL